MHIAITTLWFPHDKNPLYGIFILNQAEKLAEHVSVTVMVCRRKILPYHKKYKIGNVNVIERGGPYLPNTNEKRLEKWSKYYLDMFEEANELEKIDLVHCHDYIALYPTRQIHKEYNIPYVVTIHNTDFLRGRVDNWRGAYLRDCFNHSDKVISVGETLSLELEKYTGRRNIINIPNIVDTDLFDLGEVIESRPFKFLFIGIYEERKRVFEILKAFHMMNRKDAKLTFVGYGSQDKRMRDYVNKHNLNDQVEILPPMANKQLPIIYQSHHCYVSVSESETFGITVAEAMSCGLHVLYTKSGGPEHFVPNFGTTLLENVTAPELADKMKEMVETYDASLSCDIREHAVDNFSSVMIIRQLMEVYSNALSD